MGMPEPVYDRIGGGYTGGRREEPRIAARLARAHGPVTVIQVPIPADCADGFEAACWRRPAAILDPAVSRACSAVTLIGDAERAAGMARLSADLASGRWRRRYGHLLALDELDLGYWIVIA